MFTRVRALAPVALLVALLSGPATSGSVFVHMVMDHAPMSSHHDHHGDAVVDQVHLAHDDEHSHELVLATEVAARLTGQSLSLHLAPAVHQSPFDLPIWTATLRSTPPAQRPNPLLSKRHSILLI